MPGLVFTSDELSERWVELDRFEGSQYQRVTVSVALETGDTVLAFVYVAQV